MTVLHAQCPAASVLAGPPVGGPSIICGIAEQETELMDQIMHGESVKPLYRVTDDTMIVLGFCCGGALPVIDEYPEDGKAHYTACPLWRAAKERDWERQQLLMEPEHRPMPVPGVDGLDTGPEMVTDDDVAELLELHTPEERNAFLG